MDTPAGQAFSVNVNSSKSRKLRPFTSLNEKKIILRVYHCLARDHRGEKDELVDMCSNYTGVSKSTVYKILRQEKVYGRVQAPKCSTGRKRIEIDEDAKNAIRRAVHHFLSRNEIPTIERLLKATRKDIPKMGRCTFRRHLLSLNFNFRDLDCKRPRLSEGQKTSSSMVVCRLCLSIIQLDDSYVLDLTARNMLQKLNLKLNLDISSDPKLCRICKETMLVSYKFKTKRREKELHNEVHINNEVQTSSMTSEEKSSPCHFCQGTIDQDSLMEFDKHIANFTETLTCEKEATACRKCCGASQTHFTFVKTCLDTEQKIESYCALYGTNSRRKINLNRALPVILHSDEKPDLESNCISYGTNSQKEINLNKTLPVIIRSDLKPDLDSKCVSHDINSRGKTKALTALLHSDVELDLQNSLSIMIKEPEPELECPLIRMEEKEIKSKQITLAELLRDVASCSVPSIPKAPHQKNLNTTPTRAAISKLLELAKKKVETRSIGIQVNESDFVENFNVGIQCIPLDLGITKKLDKLHEKTESRPKIVFATTSKGGNIFKEKCKAKIRTYKVK